MTMPGAPAAAGLSLEDREGGGSSEGCGGGACLPEGSGDAEMRSAESSARETSLLSC